MSISSNIGEKTGINPVQNSIVTSKIRPNFKELQKDTVDIAGRVRHFDAPL